MKRTKLADRELPGYTRGEEIMNMVTHIVGGAVGIATLVLCIIIAIMHGNGYGVVGGIVFGTMMILLYVMSSIYHGLPKDKKAKKVMQVLDHCSIFLLIAGTYTPITLCSLREFNPVLGWSMFGIIWAISIMGIVFKAIDLKKYGALGMICYLGLGWCIVFTLGDTASIFGPGGIALLLGGGIAYTIGAIFYGFSKKRRYAHSVFHLFVLAGSILHSLFVLLYVL